MKLMTQAIATQLDKNWPDKQGLAVPVLKIFNPCGAATWLITRRDPEDPDCLWGLDGLPKIRPVLLSHSIMPNRSMIIWMRALSPTP